MPVPDNGGRFGPTRLSPSQVLREYVGKEPSASTPLGPATARVRRGSVIVVLLGQVLWLGGLLPGLLAWPGPVYWCLGVVVVAWVVTWAMIPAEPWMLAVVMVVTAVVVMGATQAQEAGSPLAAGWFDAAAITFVGMATLRRALVGLAATTAVALAAWTVLAVVTGGVEGGWRSVVVWPMATLSLGLTGAIIAAVVRGGARRLDSIAASAQRAVTAEEIVRAEGERYRARARFLHDTVVNTLAALGRGIAPESRDIVAFRCREDLAQIDRLVPGAPLRDPVSTVQARAAALGLAVRVTGNTTALADVDDPVGMAASGALGEALLNIDKHSGVRIADLHVARRGDEMVAVTISDGGRGWDGGHAPGRGISESIVDRCAAAGIAVTVTTTPGAGTTVELLLPVSRDEASDAVFLAESRIMTAVVCAILLVDLGVRAVLSLGIEVGAWRALLAYALLLAAMVAPWVVGAGVERPARSALLALSLVSLPVVLLLPEAGGPVSWVWWGSLAGIAVFLALSAIALSPWWVLVAYLAQLAGRWFMAGGGISVLFPDMLVMAIGALAVVLIRRRILALMRDADQVARDRDRVRVVLLHETADQAESLRRLQAATDAARGPLEDVASGGRQGDDPEVRRRASRAAAYLRNVSRVDPGLGGLGLQVLDLLDDALAVGAPVSLNVDPHVRLPRDAPARAALESFVSLLRGRVADGAVSLTILGAPDGGLVSAVAPGLAATTLPEAPGLQVTTAPEIPDWAEVSWSDGGAPPPDGRGSMDTPPQ
ncbi:MAG: hypothetical protein U0R64_00360 [Candidatus Nanopelagicales bacterium]